MPPLPSPGPASLVSLFGMSVMYLWTACFALREVFLYERERERECDELVNLACMKNGGYAARELPWRD